MDFKALSQSTDDQMVLIRKVYSWMSMALLMTALTAYVVANTTLLQELVLGSRFGFWALIIAQFGIVWFLSSRILSLTLNTATLLFALYSVITGATLSVLFIVYTSESLTTTFLITAGTFGAMSLYGYMTKRDLSSWGNILLMGVVGLIIASIVNYFLESSTLYWIVSCAGVLIFVGLTAYDTQKIKALIGVEDNDDTRKMALMGALMLYLDFINLFLYLLRIFGRKR